MLIETLKTLFSLTWKATKIVFSKPIILIPYLVITTLLSGGFFFFGPLETFLDACLIYLLLVLIFSLSCTFSISLLKTEINTYSDSPSLASSTTNTSFLTKLIFGADVFIFDTGIFLKSLYFIFVKNLCIAAILIYLYFLGQIDQGMSAFLFITGLAIIYTVIFWCLALFAFNMHINLMLMVPYGIIGHCNLLKALDMSIESMAGKKIATYFYFIVLGGIAAIANSPAFYYSYLGRVVICLCPIIYSTTINLFYLKTTKTSQ